MTTQQTHYDAIVIGSGMGGLTIASLLAQFKGWRVLMLERHYHAGGYMQDFSRKKFTWEVGVHYVGEMGKKEPMRRIFDFVTANGVEWAKMPDPYDRVYYPDMTYTVSSGRKQVEDNLCSLFPEETRAIKIYFDDVEKAHRWFMNRRRIGDFWRHFKRDYYEPSVQEYLDKNFKNQKLKAALCSGWTNFGLPPGQSPFFAHAVLVMHYLNGSYFPVGGSGEVVRAVEKVLEGHGGKILTKHEVKTVLVRNGKACGVVARRGATTSGHAEEITFTAPVVISDAGAYNTYLKLWPQDVGLPFGGELARFRDRHELVSCVMLFVGMEENPRDLGFDGCNYWLFPTYDHNANHRRAMTWVNSGEDPNMFVAFPSLKNPAAKSHVGQLIAPTGYRSFSKWNQKPWARRGEDYEALKASISQRLIKTAEGYFGKKLADKFVFQELSTPVTNEYFTTHERGSIYGLPAVRDRFDRKKSPWIRVKTPLKGLYLTGSDVNASGVVGAMGGGIMAAREFGCDWKLLKFLM